MYAYNIVYTIYTYFNKKIMDKDFIGEQNSLTKH